MFAMIRCRTTLVFAALAVTTAMAGCGEDDNTKVDASSSQLDSSVAIDANNQAIDSSISPNDGGSFALISSAYMEGQPIPSAHTCNGANISPALMWGNAPAGTQSFAIVFLDTSNAFLHSAIWDIPNTRTELPEDVDQDFEPADVPGAKQPNGYLGTRGYAGPCPPTGTHNYEFRLHALNVATLSGVTQNSSRAQVVTAIEAASMTSVTLTGTYIQP